MLSGEWSTTTVLPSGVQLLGLVIRVYTYVHCMNTFHMYFITVLLTTTLYTTIVDYISLVNSISLCGSSAVSVAKLCSVMDV